MKDQPHIVSIVMNGVAGDSRVIKTAKAAQTAGYRATIIGVGPVDEVTNLEIEGTQAIIVPSFFSDPHHQKLRSIPKDRRPSWLLAEDAFARMTPIIEGLKPSLIHSHDMFGLRIGAGISRALAAQGSPVPWLHDLHEYVIGLTTVSDITRLACVEHERRYLRQADHLITVSDRLAAEVQSEYRLRNCPTVIYNAPEQTDFVPDSPDVRSALGLSKETPLVVYIGVAKKERGCETIVSAVASLPDTHICFVSSSAYVNSLKQLAAELGIADRFHSLPYVAVNEVASFIRTADIGTHGLTHYPNAEVAMPNKMFEYLHAGLPMVVSDVEEMKRFVTAHSIGTVFEAESVDGCAIAIRDALRRRHELSANITKALQDKYSWDRQAIKLQKIYSGLLAKKKKRTLVLTDNILGVSRTDADVGIVNSRAPEVTCDFYLDPTIPSGHAGLLSRLVEKYERIEIDGNPSWPTNLERRALTEAGSMSQSRGRTKKDPALLRELEIIHLGKDRAVIQSLADRGFVAAFSGASMPAARSAELKTLKKKEAQLIARVIQQKGRIAELEKAERTRSFHKRSISYIRRQIRSALTVLGRLSPLNSQ